ncbi:MAG TPA: exo-alpha-sialidase [Acidimicrobiia bacterium]|nr:exo-alpha-sialidase [Acidimicrobiia bacterium]
MGVTVAVGTEKGAYLLRSDGARGDWDLEGPLFKGWKVTTFGEAGDGTYLFATGSNWFGAALHRSSDLKEWTQIVDGPTWPEGGDRKLTQIWTLTRAGDTLYAGVDEAGLFRSEDHGDTWQPVDELNEHPTRSAWQPGLGGLAAHRVVVDEGDPDRIWVAISAVGVFRSDDGGASWVAKNRGVQRTVDAEDFEDIGYCVHCIVQDPTDVNRLYRQEHRGVFRTDDGGDTWERIEEGLPAGFGFPISLDQVTGRLFVVPLESDENRLPVEGAFRVYRSDNRGDSWHISGAGHPDAATFTAVLRGAMDADQQKGIYLGTTAGKVIATADAGEAWTTLPWTLPRILSVRVLQT